MILQVENLNQSYDREKVLHGLSFSLNTGEAMMVTGPNGSGKTTLLKVIAGLIKPNSGSIMGSFFPSVFFPSSFFFHDLTLRENLDFYAKLNGTDSSRINFLISQFGLAPFLHRPFGILSLGQKIRGGLARTFLPDSSLYLLDEPLIGLDEGSVTSFMSFLKESKKSGKSFLVAGHEAAPLQGFADHRLILERKS